MRLDILIAGVGGQGTILASKLIARAAINAGEFVRTCETIGMAQRGGCVVSHVRIGDDGLSPMIPNGRAGLIIGFEPAEAVRSLPRLSPDGKVVCNLSPVYPVTATLKPGAYDVAAVYAALEARSALLVDAMAAALEAGSAKTLNVALLGAAVAARCLPFSAENIKTAIRDTVNKRFVDMNMRAFDLGAAMAQR